MVVLTFDSAAVLVASQNYTMDSHRDTLAYLERMGTVPNYTGPVDDRFMIRDQPPTPAPEWVPSNRHEKRRQKKLNKKARNVRF